MGIKCSECGSGEMRRGTIVDDRLGTYGHGQFQKRTHNGHVLRVLGKEFNIPNLSHMDDEVILICSNYPECRNYYVIKKYNLEVENMKQKVGSSKIKGYGTHHYNKR